VFCPLLSSSEHSGVPEDSQPPTFPSVGLHPHTWPKWGCDTIASSIACFLQCVCTHPIDLTSIHFLCYTHGNKCTKTYDIICNIFSIIVWDVRFHMGWKHYMRFFQVYSTPLIDESTLCSRKMKFALKWCCHYRPNPCKKKIHDLVQFKDLLSLMQLKPKKRAIVTNTPLIYSSFQQLKYLDVYIVGECVFMWFCSCHLERQRARRPSSSCLDYFSSSKNVNYIAKDVSTFYFKSAHNVSLTTYWLPPLHDTPHHHNWPIM